MGAGASSTDSNEQKVDTGAENENDVVDDLKENKKWSQVESLPEKVTHEQATEIFGVSEYIHSLLIFYCNCDVYALSSGKSESQFNEKFLY